MNNMLNEELLSFESIQKFQTKKKDYTYNGVTVPRVTQVIKESMDTEYLIGWAARLGMKNLMIERNKATTIGTVVHELIENYLSVGADSVDDVKIAPSYRKYVNKAFFNFKRWYKYLRENGYSIDVVAIEETLTCPYYAGTADCIANINGRVYVLDFKTSKKISYDYIAQVCAYMWIINNGYHPSISHVDGIGIIRVDKEHDAYEDYFLNLADPYQAELINQYYMGFSAMLTNYYNNINMRYIYSQYKKEYDLFKVLDADDIISVLEETTDGNN